MNSQSKAPAHLLVGWARERKVAYPVRKSSHTASLVFVDVRSLQENRALPDIVFSPDSTPELTQMLVYWALHDDIAICLATTKSLTLLNKKRCMHVSGQPGALENILHRLGAA